MSKSKRYSFYFTALITAFLLGNIITTGYEKLMISNIREVPRIVKMETPIIHKEIDVVDMIKKLDINDPKAIDILIEHLDVIDMKLPTSEYLRGYHPAVPKLLKIGSPAIPKLIDTVLKNPNPLKREIAVWTLHMIPESENATQLDIKIIKYALKYALVIEKDESVQRALNQSISDWYNIE